MNFRKKLAVIGIGAVMAVTALPLTAFAEETSGEISAYRISSSFGTLYYSDDYFSGSGRIENEHLRTFSLALNSLTNEDALIEGKGAYENIHEYNDENDSVPYVLPESWGMYTTGTVTKLGCEDNLLVRKTLDLFGENKIVDKTESKYDEETGEYIKVPAEPYKMDSYYTGDVTVKPGTFTYFGKVCDNGDEETLRSMNATDEDIRMIADGYDVTYKIKYDISKAVSYEGTEGASREKLDAYLSENPMTLYDSFVTEFYAARMTSIDELKAVDGITNVKGQFGIAPDAYGSGEEMFANGNLKFLYLGGDKAEEVDICPIDDPKGMGNIWFEFDFTDRGDYALLYELNSTDSGDDSESEPDDSSESEPDSSDESTDSSEAAPSGTDSNPNTGAAAGTLIAAAALLGAVIAVKRSSAK